MGDRVIALVDALALGPGNATLVLDNVILADDSEPPMV
jgi:hypothetical protein